MPGRPQADQRFHTKPAETAQLYAERARIGTTGLLAPPDWLVKDELIDLADIDGAAAALKAHQPTVWYRG